MRQPVARICKWFTYSVSSNLWNIFEVSSISCGFLLLFVQPWSLTKVTKYTMQDLLTCMRDLMYMDGTEYVGQCRDEEIQVCRVSCVHVVSWIWLWLSFVVQHALQQAAYDCQFLTLGSERHLLMFPHHWILHAEQTHKQPQQSSLAFHPSD